MAMTVWTNWSGRQTSNPRVVLRPTSESEFVTAVDRARSEGLPLRAVGTSHSHSRVAATDGVLVETDGWQGLDSVDSENELTVVRSGTKIHQIGSLLFEQGLALVNQGDIDKQSIAGAIATGTHGTGITLQNLSNAVASVKLVLADGSVVTTSDSHEPELFAVARHSLGAVGLVTHVGLRVREAYTLHEKTWVDEPDNVFAHHDELIASTRHFEFFWDPQSDRCLLKSLAETGAAPDDMPAARFERVDWSHRIISSIRDDLHTEMEYSVPAEAGPECFAELRSLVKSDFPDLTWPLEYRTVKADDLWISAATGRETVTISAHQGIDTDDHPLFEACEDVFRRFEGRPHWGKVHDRSGGDLAQLYPRYSQWWAVRDRFDPDGVFLTPDLERLRP